MTRARARVEQILRPFVSVEPGEWPMALLMFLYFFLTITAYYVIKPVRDSLFLEKYGADKLPYIWMATIVILSAIAPFYFRAADRIKKDALLSGTVLFFVSNLLLFWWLAGSRGAWVTAAYYVWVSIFSITSTTTFWMCANDLYNPRQAKRLFGFIGTGGVLGGMVGGLITSLSVKALGTRNLLLAAAVILAPCAFLIRWLLNRHDADRPEEAALPRADQTPLTDRKALRRELYKSKYLLLLLGLVCVAKIVSGLVDFQFKKIVEESIIGLDERTHFFGAVFTSLNCVAFFVQFFLTSRILKNFGVQAALLLLPLGILTGSIGILAVPGLWASVGTFVHDGCLNYSLNQSSKEMLYLPIERRIRYRVKPMIDILAYRISKAAAGPLILLFIKFGHFNARQLSLVSLVLVGGWLFMIVLLRKEYVQTLRSFLVSEAKPLPLRPINQSEALLRQALGETGDGALQIEPESADGALTKDVKELLEKLESPSCEIRHRVVRALDEIRRENPALEFRRGAIVQAVERETLHYHQVKAIQSAYLAERSFGGRDGGRARADLFFQAQEIRLQEILERIFLLLGLLGDTEDMRAIREGLAHESDYVKANALELLDNVGVEGTLRKKLSRMFDYNPARHQRDGRLVARIANEPDLWSRLSASYLLARPSVILSEAKDLAPS